MARECPKRSFSDSELLFHVSLAFSSKNTEFCANDGHDDDSNDFDDGFVFDIDPTLLIDLHKLVIGDIIGEGSHSIVYNGWYQFKPVAIKVMLPIRTRAAAPECKARFQREVKLLSRMEHKNVVKFIGASVEPSMLIITELLGGGSLQKNLKSIYPMTLDLAKSLSYALDISQAMEYLHANGIIHRDLKPGNLLLTEDKMHLKIADFGIAREICDEMTCEVGSYRYMAPELFSKDPLPKGAKKCYDHKVDVYSFAMVLWSLIKNQVPFKERKDLMAAYATANNKRPSVDEFPEYIVPLVQSCWEEDPKLRPEFSDISKVLTKLLQHYRTIKNKLSSIAEIDELDSLTEDEEEQSPNTTLNQTPTPTPTESAGNNSSKNYWTISPTSGCIKREEEEECDDVPVEPTKPKRRNRKPNCLALFFRRCFGI